ncbi:MAG: restriction endonuclease subunit S [Muricauda sp.]|nr:restriction endonuclease subunit S [Allomuricauda sp.]MBO6532209.1 restriction endonuclease subunit S [Allomuricauda sp.]MBO6590093.1 restriction endonuclease subunit S [Allomuricauda sp.]MBO6619759.1 restriction endonuclease subunit S [Allomuricauda sp.]MBO6645614.1 restriction endonuclease subunit S [Allomuricauda sp.]MBO6748097.1 restriction endonuclease subunit S [Allomuricauda sp.]
MAKVSRTPELRFPEFQDNWNEKRIGNLGEFIGGGTPDSYKKEYWEGEIPWVSSSDINEDSIHLISKTRFITEEAIVQSATKKVPKGSILMVSRVGIGKFAVADSELCTSQDFTNLVSTQNEYFLAYYFKARSKRFVRLSQGTSIKGFTTHDIKSAKFSIPQPEEQQKIAAFLTAVDQRIQLLQQKKAKLEEYKKGVMQKLFSQEIRFKPAPSGVEGDENGNDFPDWEEKKLGEVSTFRRGSFPQPYGLPKWYDGENSSPFVQVYDVGENFKLKEVTKQRISELAKSKSVFVEKGSVVLTIQGSIGRIAITQYDSYVDRTLLIFKSFKIHFDKIYFAYAVYLLFEREKRVAVGGTIKTITKEKLSDFIIPIPSFREQQKIAAFLSSLDESIASVAKQIEATTTFKKGLLQKMFV